MQRQTLESGGWFDLDAATKYEESVFWNGNNNISSATGSQWDHEALYVTRTGRYVLNSYSQMSGRGESWVEVDADWAAAWLVRCGHQPVDNATAAAMATQEI